jgi:hypothetical protein
MQMWPRTSSPRNARSVYCRCRRPCATNLRAGANLLNVLGITSNVCISHATGNVQFFCAVMRQVTFNCAVFQVSLWHTFHTSSSSPMLQLPTTITTSCSIQVKSVLINLLCEYSACWCNISELATVIIRAIIKPTGVRDSGRAIVVDIVSFIAGMRAATTIWAWK